MLKNRRILVSSIVGIITIAAMVWYVNAYIYKFLAAYPLVTVDVKTYPVLVSTAAPSAITSILPNTEFDLRVTLSNQPIDAVDLYMLYDQTKVQYLNVYSHTPSGYFTEVVPIEKTLVNGQEQLHVVLVSLAETRQNLTSLSFRFKSLANPGNVQFIIDPKSKITGVTTTGVTTFYDKSPATPIGSLTIVSPPTIVPTNTNTPIPTSTKAPTPTPENYSCERQPSGPDYQQAEGFKGRWYGNSGSKNWQLKENTTLLQTGKGAFDITRIFKWNVSYTIRYESSPGAWSILGDCNFTYMQPPTITPTSTLIPTKTPIPTITKTPTPTVTNTPILTPTKAPIATATKVPVPTDRCYRKSQGDADCDGIIHLKDGICWVLEAQNAKPANCISADFNGNGIVGTADLVEFGIWKTNYIKENTVTDSPTNGGITQ